MMTHAIPAAEHAARRERLLGDVGGPILLLGGRVRDRNLPGYGYPFRQDSTFLYLTGCTLPDAVALVTSEGSTLFLPPTAEGDALWHGEVPTADAIRESHGFDRILPRDELARHVTPATRALACSDAAVNAEASAHLGRPLSWGREHGDAELVRAIIRMRRRKSPTELDAVRAIGRRTRLAFEAVMRATRPGVSEQALNALFEAVLASRGNETGYATILTQRGEILHNHAHDGILEAGRLLLLDGGGEAPSGYGCDITRTWPVNGRFDARQRAAYAAVLEAQLASIATVRVGVEYRSVHDASSLVIARFLADERLISCDPETAVEIGAHALFFPHGVGHHLGLDVHDMENFGDLPSYPDGVGRSDQFGTRYLRLNLPLEADWVVTIEPGFYVVPAILRDPVLRERFAGVVDFARAESWIGFGGIRIEDDVRVTADGREVLTDVPKEIVEIEGIVGSGDPFRDLL